MHTSPSGGRVGSNVGIACPTAWIYNDILKSLMLLNDTDELDCLMLMLANIENHQDAWMFRVRLLGGSGSATPQLASGDSDPKS